MNFQPYILFNLRTHLPIPSLPFIIFKGPINSPRIKLNGQVWSVLFMDSSRLDQTLPSDTTWTPFVSPSGSGVRRSRLQTFVTRVGYLDIRVKPDFRYEALDTLPNNSPPSSVSINLIPSFFRILNTPHT